MQWSFSDIEVCQEYFVISEALGKEFLISFVANTITLDSAKKAPNVQLQLLMKSKH